MKYVPKAKRETEEARGTVEYAAFGGGCFWCTEAVFGMVRGVVSVMPGYAGGYTGNPTHQTVSGGQTGHAEVVRIAYDRAHVSFADLLTIFFTTHDPTTPNRQGHDVGPQYRSIILYTSERQKEAAERYIAAHNAAHRNRPPAITEVRLLSRFFEAEPEHRKYFARNHENAYCAMVINPKLRFARERLAAHLVAEEVPPIRDPIPLTATP